MADGNRRSALVALAGTAMAGAGAALSACSRGKAAQGEVTANEDLMREHGVLRRILVAYREVAQKLTAGGQPIDAGALGEAAGLFRTFGEHYHEQLLEEQHIFPAVRKARGEAALLVDNLLAQHARGREITGFILDKTKTGAIATGAAGSMARALTAFCRMYEPHTAREDTIVFPAFKRALGEKHYDEIGDRFEDIEKQTFGGDGFEMALAKVTDIERRLGLTDLGLFTAPPQ